MLWLRPQSQAVPQRPAIRWAMERRLPIRFFLCAGAAPTRRALRGLFYPPRESDAAPLREFSQARAAVQCSQLGESLESRPHRAAFRWRPPAEWPRSFPTRLLLRAESAYSE